MKELSSSLEDAAQGSCLPVLCFPLLKKGHPMESLMSIVIVEKLGSALLEQMSTFLLIQNCILALAAPGHQKGWHSRVTSASACIPLHHHSAESQLQLGVTSRTTVGPPSGLRISQ